MKLARASDLAIPFGTSAKGAKVLVAEPSTHWRSLVVAASSTDGAVFSCGVGDSHPHRAVVEENRGK
jgi:hypothetical protein